MVDMQRGSVRSLFSNTVEQPTEIQPHAGLWLSRGLAEWDANNPTEKGKAFQAHIAKAAGLPCPEVYKAAYSRWESIVLDSPHCAFWAGKLEGRLFIGMGGPSVLEAAIALSKTYGVPMIPASAVKGLVSAHTRGRIDDNTRVGLFGKADDDPDACEAGYVVFHDAWWIPDCKPTPLAAEVVTVHHPGYYQTEGKTDATDFDSPNPNPQIAARGSFLFAVECAAPTWAEFARERLAEALTEWGIGGKTAAGYGYFVADDKVNQDLEERRKQKRREELSPNLQSIADLSASMNPGNKNRGRGHQLYRDLLAAIQKAAGWPEHEQAELRRAAVEIFDWLGIKNGDADRKRLLRGLETAPRHN